MYKLLKTSFSSLQWCGLAGHYLIPISRQWSGEKGTSVSVSDSPGPWILPPITKPTDAPPLSYGQRSTQLLVPHFLRGTNCMYLTDHKTALGWGRGTVFPFNDASWVKEPKTTLSNAPAFPEECEGSDHHHHCCCSASSIISQNMMSLREFQGICSHGRPGTIAVLS